MVQVNLPCDGGLENNVQHYLGMLPQIFHNPNKQNCQNAQGITV